MSDEHAETGWVLVNPAADWEPRDSIGRFVFDDRLWVLGGWLDAQLPNPRDVWSSPDGETWTQVLAEAPWTHSDLPVSLVHAGRMWMMGGRKLPGTDVSSEVWSSSDGRSWQFEGPADWLARCGAGYVTFRGRMWVMGGCSDFYHHDQSTTFNDVWSSSDGRNWRLELQEAPWSKRTHMQCVVHDGKIWLAGGGVWRPSMEPRSDVWCSEDGINWTPVTEAAPWAGRIWFSFVSYRGHLWVIAGCSFDDANLNDVWYSADGEHWSEFEGPAPWTVRHETSAYVLHDRIWLLGGHADPLTSEVWTLYLPEKWNG